MPVVSEKQRRMTCADLGRAEAGQQTRTGMSKGQLGDFCRKQKGHTPGDGTGMDASRIPSQNALTAVHGPARR